MLDMSLYLVTARYAYSDEKFFSIIDEACRSGVTIVQLREKDVTTRRLFDLAIKVKQITDRYHVQLIIDDRIDICLAVEASGVHIGDDEMPIDISRKLLGPDKILGVSAKTVERAKYAEQFGADYLGTGAIFPTETKVITKHTDIRTLDEITKSVDIPVVAIGGINTSNVGSFSNIPIAGVAVVSEIMKSKNVSQTVSELKTTINK
ncbi:thiamine phosphate synthase [Companilactobacillus ginsenosidimutans]|uniref:Thiamine-phosphate synthase n=1 Tax=Companilactobacillus ginsenosidimutans TaxID=1007676 RepID=A0A0H4QI08_9LACO|nr:thiamine phosphate synthase [Companilactobacillus ginsenosidimutans]AKP67572.1 thiamine-phosphate pyrophosphorylase [Companilactobacillus ginsenosidimutans]